MTDTPTTRPLTPEESAQIRTRQRGRNRMMGLILGFLAILFFAITIVKITIPEAHS
jgi:hypothetical protein